MNGAFLFTYLTWYNGLRKLTMTGKYKKSQYEFESQLTWQFCPTIFIASIKLCISSITCDALVEPKNIWPYCIHHNIKGWSKKGFMDLFRIFIFFLGVSDVNCHSLMNEMKRVIKFTFMYYGLVTSSKYVSLCWRGIFFYT